MPKKEYILCYFLENKKWYFDYAKQVALALKLPLLLVPNRYEFLQKEFVAKNGVSVERFVGLIENAGCVLTDSYHGSIFSIIFKRNFMYMQRFDSNDPNSQNIRVTSLTELTGLEERVIRETDRFTVPAGIDYEVVSKRLEKSRNESKQYLMSNIILGEQ